MCQTAGEAQSPPDRCGDIFLGEGAQTLSTSHLGKAWAGAWWCTCCWEICIWCSLALWGITWGWEHLPLLQPGLAGIWLRALPDMPWKGWETDKLLPKCREKAGKALWFLSEDKTVSYLLTVFQQEDNLDSLLYSDAFFIFEQQESHILLSQEGFFLRKCYLSVPFGFGVLLRVTA